MHEEESVVINRPPEEVFDYVANRENLPEWSTPILEVRKQTQGPLTEEGARYTTVAKFFGRRVETPFEVTVQYGADTAWGGGGKVPGGTLGWVIAVLVIIVVVYLIYQIVV